MAADGRRAAHQGQPLPAVRRATRACSVRVARLGLALDFAEGETIWTESSHRFGLDELRGWADAAGFRCARQWVDERWPFAHSLLVAG